MIGLPRSAAADPVPVAPSVEVTKVFGPGTPESFRQGEATAQMTPASPFSPGTPIGPYDGYNRHTRQFNFETGYNISTRPRLHEAVSFDTLTGLVESYDVAQIVIWHRIDSIRSLDWKLVGADHYFGDVSDAIPLGLAALRKPDRKNAFKTWLAKFLYDILAWDAGALYRLRNRGGRCIGLQPVDGRTIAPLLDYWGNSPDEPAEAYVQYVNGLPWGWLTRSDLIYEPFRPVTGSPYGRPPIESVILNANTDLRFQVYFLQRFTEGNLPAAFASSPESWTPEQIEIFQQYWDSFMFADQSRKHQVRWMPGGSKMEWSDEKDFSDLFSLFMMRKTAAAYHVVPSDLGFTESVNRSSGESQADVQHRVGDLPLMEHVEGILAAFLQDDLGLPLKFEFDRGEEQVDQLAQAQADQAYIDRAVVSPSEIRELRYGLVDTTPVPRMFFTARSGPIPLIALDAVAGDVDPQTAAPAPGAELPHKAFTEVEGVLSTPPLVGTPLAEQEYGPSAVPAAPVAQVVKVVKEGEGGGGEAGPGITAQTGIYSYDLDGRDDDQDDDGEATAAAVAKELAVFRRYSRGRRQRGDWRDFDFRTVDAIRAHRMNDAGRFAVRKAAGEVACAGLAVVAADTGRVLMLQRALCDDDPAAGMWEFPGGHLEGTETPLQGAWREWAEETGCIPPPGQQTGGWVSANGIYEGIAWTVESEASVPVRGGTVTSNPDDPDGDQVEAIAWWDPAALPGNPAVRAELQENIGDVLDALGVGEPDCCGAACCADGCCGGQGGCSCVAAGDGEDVAKAADANPKGAWPGWDHDLHAASHWAVLLVAALTALLGPAQAEQMAAAWLQEHPGGQDGDQGKQLAVEAGAAWAAGWLASQGIDLASACGQQLPGIITDGWLIGGASADALATGSRAAWGGWTPGDTGAAQARVDDLGLAAGLGAAVTIAGANASQIAGGVITRIARTLVDGLADGTGAVALGAGIFKTLSDQDYAHGSVLAQLVVASAAAAMAVYLAKQVQQLNWVSEDDNRVCAACLANEAGSPYMAARAPSCPQHPGCRCALVPAR